MINNNSNSKGSAIKWKPVIIIAVAIIALALGWIYIVHPMTTKHYIYFDVTASYKSKSHAEYVNAHYISNVLAISLAKEPENIEKLRSAAVFQIRSKLQALQDFEYIKNIYAAQGSYNDSYEGASKEVNKVLQGYDNLYGTQHVYGAVESFNLNQLAN